MKHFSTPAWTFGNKTEAEPKTTDKFNPGPGTYFELKEDAERDRTPPAHKLPAASGWKFGTGQRKALHSKTDYPGPGSYQAPEPFGTKSKSVARKDRGAHQESAEKKQLGTPGPGTYNPQPASRATSYTMGNKVFSIQSGHSEKQLGPGEYHPSFKPVHYSKSFKIGTGNRPDLYQIDKNLGDRDYQVTVNGEGPVFSFAKGPRPGPNKANDVPPPWAYTHSAFTDNLNTKGKTMGRRTTHEQQTLLGPGPGAHDVAGIRSAPSFSMGVGKRPTFKTTNGPGPSEYSLPAATVKQTKGTFGKSNRPPLTSNKETPGPGLYEILTSFKTGPSYGIVGRNSNQKNLMDNPGPGEYIPVITSVKPEGASHVFGTGERSNALRTRPRVNPGPGHYYRESKKPAHQWTFGKDPRDREDLNDEPGPGHYDIPATVPDVPNYLIPPTKFLN